MGFDPANPTDTEELRRVGTVIRPNWVAIQQADPTFKPYAVNLDNRTELAIADDPTAIADTFIMYSKDASTTTPSLTEAELFGINENGNIIQFTMGLPVRASTGNSFFPGTSAGVIKTAWGNITMTTSPSSTVTPGFATLYQYYMTVVGNVTNNFAVEAVGSTGFRFIRGSGTSSTIIRWFAIGI
jgi:hypothetical protein